MALELLPLHHCSCKCFRACSINGYLALGEWGYEGKMSPEIGLRTVKESDPERWEESKRSWLGGGGVTLPLLLLPCAVRNTSVDLDLKIIVVIFRTFLALSIISW